MLKMNWMIELLVLTYFKQTTNKSMPALKTEDNTFCENLALALKSIPNGRKKVIG